MNGSIWLMLLLQTVLIFLNAVFASAEIAVISMNDTKLAKLTAEGNKRAKRLTILTSQPARFLATIQVAITISGFLGSAFAADNFSDRVVQFLLKIGVSLPEKTLDSIAVIVITLILSYFTLVFGELVPKRVAMRKAEKMALGMSGMIYGISKAFAPLVWLLTVSTNGILRLLGIDPNAVEDGVSEEDIRMLVDVGNEKGAIDNDEKEFIQNVFEFDDLNAGEIATHRTEVSLLWMDESMEDWSRTIHDSRHTFYPVCDETVDRVVGILNAKDYFRIDHKDRELVMKRAVKPAYFIPESVKADVLFKNMKKNRTSLSVVLDEYGGMVGIVTMNDLIERLVGDLNDEPPSADDRAPIERIDSKTWKIHGSAELHGIEEALGISLPSEEFDTFNGFVFNALGSIPDDGSKFEVEAEGLIIKVKEVRDHQIRLALVCRDESAPKSVPDEAE